MARRLQRTQARLTEAHGAAAADRAAAQESLRRMQDMQAEIFRLNDQFVLVQMDAQAAYARGLDLESEVRQEQSRFMELQARTNEVGELLHKALDAHAQANSIWEAELSRMGDSSAREIGGLLEARERDMTQLRRSHELHVASLTVAHQSEIQRLLSAHRAEVVPLKERLEFTEARLEAQSGLRGASTALLHALVRRVGNVGRRRSPARIAALHSQSDSAPGPDEQ